MTARACWFAIAAAVGVAACERLVGIHGPGDAGFVDARGTGGAGPRDAPVADLAADSGASDVATADGQGDRAPDTGAGGAGGNPRDASGTGGASGDGGDAGDAGDAGADANHCGALWHVESASAGVFTIAATATTACGFAASALPALTAALDTTNFRGALACGSCLRVQPTFGSTSVVVQVVDLGGASGMLLNQAAIDRIATPGSSSLTVDWQLVPCDTQGQNVAYYIKDGSTSNYVGVQIRRQRYPVTSVLAVGTRGQTTPFNLQTYNYWESTVAGIGSSPLTLRLTDINGDTLEDTGIAVTPLAQTSGASQFPTCQ